MSELAKFARAEPPQHPEEYRDVMVYLDHWQGKLKNASLEMIGVGRKLADKTKSRLICALAGYQTESMAREAGEYGCDVVMVADNPELKLYRSTPYSEVVADFVFRAKPNVLIVPGTKNGRDLAARVAVKVQSGLTADCMDIDIETDTGILLARRPDYGDSTMSEIRCEKHRPQMATSRPGTFEIPPKLKDHRYSVEKVDFEFKKEQLREEILGFTPRGGDDITASKVIVAGGLGLGSPKGIELLRELAKELGGNIGVTRPVADLGWVPREYQVGQTGKIVRPRLYIAAGISGKPQHIVGMMDSGTVISINTDEKADIHKFADYIIVDDLYTVIPKMIEEIRRLKQGQVEEAAEQKGS
ncbi:electron transfer flavoprotein subunit alpha/FixB family protein [Thermogymnomonas acidicola]|uniref:Electron transfer flavoprotein subunit alpha/FixB family protein n=2 Tax=Thermogymnomonas acidicola TaxID=399579 RepID=A0AA37BQZ8_9ARCH|nr:electron transfer flavoprotein subunit alpha/FixB family protein [Thermogymnomonas acidicola]GGM71914.1 electron transfer flavoprotein subunit alpha/FixB family protein [Thermogymnomonas acidicola]